MNKKFKPRLIPSLTAFVMLVTLLGLGAWQLDRLAWKTDLLTNIREKMAMPPVPLPENVDDLNAWEFRRVTMAGKFLHDKMFLLKPRTLEGRNGYHMVTAFQRASGGIVFVNRGWVSDDTIKKATRPEGLTQVEGIVQVPRKRYFTPNNNPVHGDWYWADIPAMRSFAQMQGVAPVIVTISQKQTGIFPVGGRLRLEIPNDHQQYAIFWFGMSFVLLIIWIIFSFQPVPEIKEENNESV